MFRPFLFLSITVGTIFRTIPIYPISFAILYFVIQVTPQELSGMTNYRDATKKSNLLALISEIGLYCVWDGLKRPEKRCNNFSENEKTHVKHGFFLLICLWWAAFAGISKALTNHISQYYSWGQQPNFIGKRIFHAA